MEEINIKSLIFRRLSYLDFVEFKRAAVESISTNEAYLAFGHIFKNITILEYMDYYSDLLKNTGAEAYGLFHRNTLLGFVGFEFGFTKSGASLLGWARNGYQNLGLGELGLNTACEVAFNAKGFNYVELTIDSSNAPSRKVAEKSGFKPYLKLKFKAGSDNTYIYYVKINPKIEKLSRIYNKRPIDIIYSPASAPTFHHYLRVPSICEFYDWPFDNFDENSKPTNIHLLDSYLSIINFEPNQLKED
jgi:RimJ/RimL family protein N-acetyltransferase